VPFLDILLHRATPWSRRTETEDELAESTWVEGEYVTEKVDGTPFDCVLFLPQGVEEASPRGRRVRTPTLLYGPEDDEGAEIGLLPEDEVVVVAPELNLVEGLAEDAGVRWLVVGHPQPFGKPGDPVIGFQATLRRIED
jgi:hypothetical protein